MAAVGLDDLKGFARKAALAARKAAHGALDETRRAEATARLSHALAPFGAVPLAGYMPIRTEIDPLAAMATHPGPVGVPVILGEGQPLVFRRWHPGADMVPGPFGAMIPAEGAEVIPRVLIVPLVAFDRRGFRLGYGGGFYDRTLEGLRARGPVTAIGFAYAGQEVEEVPVEATDQPLDLIVTERDIIHPEDP